MLQTIHTSPVLTWQEIFSDLVTDPIELMRFLQLSEEDICLSAIKDFPLRVPRPYLARMEKGNAKDPLLLQVLPSNEEHLAIEGYSFDPLGEVEANLKPGLLQKYQGRALLIPTSACAIHCRYCFRRHFPYDDNKASKTQWLDSLGHIASDASISEVILSGGDPLAMSDKHLGWLIEQLNAIPHLRRLRIHTRLPIMIPQRVNQGLCDLLAKQNLQTVLVLHCNHAQELDKQVDAACARLKAANVTLLNQSVLLKGINNSSSSLIALSERLFQAGALPYYLHLPDKVSGTAHFNVARKTAVQLMQTIQKQLPGYLLPKLVQEIAGQPSKSLVHFSY